MRRIHAVLTFAAVLTACVSDTDVSDLVGGDPPLTSSAAGHPIDDFESVVDDFVTRFAASGSYEWGRSVRGTGDVVPARGRGSLLAVEWTESIERPLEFTPTIDRVEVLTACNAPCDAQTAASSLVLDAALPVLVRAVTDMSIDLNLSIVEVDGDVVVGLWPGQLGEALAPIESEREAYLLTELPAAGLSATRPIWSRGVDGDWYILTATGDDVLCHPTGLTLRLWFVGHDAQVELVDEARRELNELACA